MIAANIDLIEGAVLWLPHLQPYDPRNGMDLDEIDCYDK